MKNVILISDTIRWIDSGKVSVHIFTDLHRLDYVTKIFNEYNVNTPDIIIEKEGPPIYLNELPENTLELIKQYDALGKSLNELLPLPTEIEIQMMDITF